MATYLVTPASPRIPATRVTAADLYDLGERIAAHIARHKGIRAGFTYDIALDEGGGQIRQHPQQPINFTIRKDT